MIETVLIICLAGLFFFYIQHQDDRKTIEQQNAQLRKFKGIKNEEDELENQKLMECHHFKMILIKIQQDELLSTLDKKTQIEESKLVFENKYGYKFSDPFNEY